MNISIEPDGRRVLSGVFVDISERKAAEVAQGARAVGDQLRHFLEAEAGAVEETGALVVAREGGHGGGFLVGRQAAAVEDAAVDPEGPIDLADVAVEVAEQDVDLDGIAVVAHDLAQVPDRPVRMPGDELGQAARKARVQAAMVEAGADR